MQEMGQAANTISENDLSISVTPKSDKDELGNAFQRMVEKACAILWVHVTESANSLGAAAEQLSSAANQAGQANQSDRHDHPTGGQGHARPGLSGDQGPQHPWNKMGQAIEGVRQGCPGKQSTSVMKASATNRSDQHRHPQGGREHRFGQGGFKRRCRSCP